MAFRDESAPRSGSGQPTGASRGAPRRECGQRDITRDLLHGEEQQVHADDGYSGVKKREKIVALDRKIAGQIAAPRGTIKPMTEGAENEALQAVERAQASVRAFVEPPFHIVKNLFRHRNVRYRGRVKNGHQLYTLFGLANVVISGRTVTT